MPTGSVASYVISPDGENSEMCGAVPQLPKVYPSATAWALPVAAVARPAGCAWRRTRVAVRRVQHGQDAWSRALTHV